MHITEAEIAASIGEGSRLFVSPAMACVASGPWLSPPLYGDQTTTGEEHPAYLSKSGVDVRPVVHGGDRPHDRSRIVKQRDRLSDTFGYRTFAGRRVRSLATRSMTGAGSTPVTVAPSWAA